MYYSSTRAKELEKFPNIMPKEDLKELSSIINLLNSTANPDEKIGLNLQYRQLKVPEKTLLLIEEKIKNANRYLKNEIKDENIQRINRTYEDNKSKEEIFIRNKEIEKDNLDKTIKKLNLEEVGLSQEYENINNRLYNLDENMNAIRKDNEKIKNSIKSMENERKNLENKISELEVQNKINYDKKKKLNELNAYLKEQKELKEEEENIKEMLCYKCKSQPRIYYYSECKHLALCKDCFETIEKNTCPICKNNNELVMKVLLE